jgi:hypothetical protein
MADIVLVHGTTQNAAGFWRLSGALADRGHRPLTVRVPSAAANASVEYAELLADQLPQDVRRPVVAAHSASGLLLPALARRFDAACQVWMAAVVADYAGGRSLLSEVRADPGALFHDERLGIDPTTDRALATYFLFHDADLATLQDALRTVAACDLSAIYAELPPVDPVTRPATYLLPVGDRALTNEGMRRMARERLEVEPVEVPGGHNNYVAHPGPVADAIEQAASSHR